MLRQSADVPLCEAVLAQRAQDAQLGHRLQAGSVVAIIVDVGALQHRGDAFFPLNVQYLPEQLPFAQVAVVLRVVGEPLHRKLLGRKHDLPDAV